MRVLLVDDEPLALERLDALMADIDGVQVVGLARDGIEAAEKIEALRPDLALLDIQMPQRGGLAVAAALKGRADTEVVFVTAFHHFAVEAFDVDAVDYLLKPVEPGRLKLALDRARRRRAEGREDPPAHHAREGESGAPYVTTLWVRRPRGLVRVEVDAVEWIEAARDYVLLHTPARSHMYRSTMDALWRQLDPTQMLRVSRSAIVRRAAVAQVRRRGRGQLMLELADGSEIPVGNTYARAVAGALGMRLHDDD